MVRERFADLARVEVTLLFGDRGIGSRGLFADQVRLLDPWFLSLYVPAILVHPDAKMSVTTWARIDQRPEAQRLLIDNAFESRMTNNYDLSRPMRRRNT
jgi:hypothetical protein